MGRRAVSVAFQGDKTAEEYASLARLAEELGFDAVSVYADLGFQPAIVPLLAMARATTRVRLGPAALNPSLLHPVEIAGQIAALDAASGGRSYLGLARGAWLDALGAADDRPLTRLREAIEVIRRLLSGNRQGYEGRVFRLAPGFGFNYPLLRSEIPLLIGTWGPKLAALAGAVAAEVKVGGSANPALVPVLRDHLAHGATAAGRPPNSVGIVLGAVTVVDENGAAARARARQEVARYLPVVAPLDPTVEVPEDLLRQMAALVTTGAETDAAALVPDDLLDRFAFSGTPAQVARQAQALFDAGASRVEFGTPHGRSDADGVRLLGERVLPALR
ncbi:MAG: LLM class flavin-dependent oxidoreductase [Chloroflexota bacterium]|nr:LLM class flavin-dependent oxidoreductase [Chloroflexota bacterium]